jgi:hypothetical protein
MKNNTQKISIRFTRNTLDTKVRTTGFTVIELVTSLMISFVVLTAVVTLAYAMSSAHNSTSDINEKQAHIRYTSLRISELIKYSKLLCDASSNELVIWRVDDNNDNQINVSEITYIETGGGKYLRLLQFNPLPVYDSALPLFLLRSPYLKGFLKFRHSEIYTTLIEQCSNISITLDKYPPYTQLVNISFDIEENQQIRTYQISSALRCNMSNLITTYDTLSKSDDDLP